VIPVHGLVSWALLLAGISGQVVAEIAWPFVTDGWIRAEGSPAHRGDDEHAQDWIRSGPSGPMRGDPVLASISGRVVAATWSCSSYGKTVVLLDPLKRLAIRVAHLDDILVAVGNLVEASQTVIGTVGSTGPKADCPAAGMRPPEYPHLHIAVYRNADSTLERPINLISFAPNSPFAASFLLRRPPS
jgi:hypothetical protein